jgi:Family of unknown function (DUF6049)
MRRLSAWCALTVLLLLALGASATPGAAQTSPASTVVLRLVHQPAFNDPKHTSLDVQVRAVNTTDTTYDALSVGVTIQTPVGSRTEYEESLRADTGVVFIADTSPVSGRLAPGDTRTITLPTVDLTGLAQRAETAIYPMKVELRSNDLPVATLRSPVIFLANPKPLVPLDLTWTFVLSSPIVYEPDGSFRTPWLQRQVSHGGPLRAEAEALAKLTRQPATPSMDVAVAPQLVDQLLRMRAGYTIHTRSGETVRVPAGRAGAANAAQLLRDLRRTAGSSSVELSSMPFASPSVPALIGAGLASDLPAQIGRGRDDVAAALRQDPATGILHPPGSRLDQASLFELHQNGVRLLLVDDNTVNQPSPALGFAKPAVSALSVGTSSPLEAIAPDHGVQSMLESTLPAQDPHLAVQSILGELASIWLERPSVPRGVATILSERTGLPGYFYEPFVRAIDAAPWLRPMKASAMAAVHEPHAGAQPAELAGRTGPTFSAAYLADLNQARNRIATYRAVIAEDAKLPDQLERYLLIAEAGQFASNEDLGREFLQAIIDTLRKQLALVAPDTTTQDRTLTSRTGNIPVSILNRTGHAVKVQVELDGGGRLTVQAPNPRTVKVPADGVTLQFHVQAKTTGRFPVQVVVKSPDGATLSQGRLVVRSTAYNRVALVLTIGAALFLMALWARRFVPWAKR